MTIFCCFLVYDVCIIVELLFSGSNPFKVSYEVFHYDSRVYLVELSQTQNSHLTKFSKNIILGSIYLSICIFVHHIFHSLVMLVMSWTFNFVRPFIYIYHTIFFEPWQLCWPYNLMNLPGQTCIRFHQRWTIMRSVMLQVSRLYIRFFQTIILWQKAAARCS